MHDAVRAALQERFGYVHEDAVPMIADALNMSRAEVFGCVSFYHDFKRQPPSARHELKLCRAEACQAGPTEISNGPASWQPVKAEA